MTCPRSHSCGVNPNSGVSSLQPPGAVNLHELTSPEAGRQTHPLPRRDTSENSSPLTCKMGIKSLPHRTRGGRGCLVKASHPPACLPESPEQEDAGERQGLPVSLLGCVSVEGTLTPPGRQKHQPGPRRADPPSTPPLRRSPGRERVLPGAPAPGRAGPGPGPGLPVTFWPRII